MSNFEITVGERTLNCFGVSEIEGVTFFGCTNDTVIAMRDSYTKEVMRKQLQIMGQPIMLYNGIERTIKNDKGLEMGGIMNNFTYNTIKHSVYEYVPKVQLCIKGYEKKGELHVLKVMLRYYEKRTTVNIAVMPTRMCNDGRIGVENIWYYIRDALTLTKMEKEYMVAKMVRNGMIKKTVSDFYTVNSKLETSLKNLFGAYYGQAIGEVMKYEGHK